MDLNSEFKKQLKNDCLYKFAYNFYEDNNNLNEILYQSGAIQEFRTEIDEESINDYSLLTLPILDYQPQYINNKPKQLAVVVSTGSFSPMHKGHVDAMVIAKKYIEDNLGYQVIQGVMSLSHDGYVAFKNNGIAKLNVGARTEKAYEMTKDEDWITIDRFEGEMVSCPINFSTVLNRVKKYLTFHNEAFNNIKVFYIFGSDNAAFSRSFVENEIYQSICIERANYSFDEIQQELKQHKNIHFVKNNKETSGLSSTIIRKKITKQADDNHKKQIYFIRTDNVSMNFASKLKELIERFVNKKVEVRFINSSDYINVDMENTISLDKFIKAEYNLDVSREFQLSGSQKTAKKMVSMSESLISQILKIKKGSYWLLDDDSVSGFTLKSVENILNQNGIKILGYNLLIKNALKENEELYDVIDARDFCFRSVKNGLVVKLFSNELARVPYIYPFVNLTSRANIKPDYQIEFSMELLALNEKENKDFLCDDVFDFVGLKSENFIQKYKKYFNNYIQSAHYDN